MFNFMKSTQLDFSVLTDSYNASHFKLYPKNTTEVSGYIEARSNSIFENISFFGLQYFLKEYVINVSKSANYKYLESSEYSWKLHGLPFNFEGWQTLRDEYGSSLPIEIQSVSEGSWIPKGNVLVQVRNTDPRFYWLPTWIETMLVQNVWYASTVATVSKSVKLLLYKYLKATGCENIEQILPFMLHDFGFRGASSLETACIGGAAHLTNFLGSDTFPALRFIDTYYTKNISDILSAHGCSIPATNHATITSWGQENEILAYQNVLDQYLGPNTIVACVSDSYNLWAAIDSWGTTFRNQIRDSGGRLVIRPDSGDPVEIVPKAIEKLMKYFGAYTNRKGFKVLNECVRVIWGDGINPFTIDEVLFAMKQKGLAAENVVFGMGGALLQQVNRDMGSFAFKINEVVVDGKRRPVSKNPATGLAKSSKSGRLALIKQNNEFFTIKESELKDRKNLLNVVYCDGDLLVDDDFKNIRNRALEGIY